MNTTPSRLDMPIPAFDSIASTSTKGCRCLAFLFLTWRHKLYGSCPGDNQLHLHSPGGDSQSDMAMWVTPKFVEFWTTTDMAKRASQGGGQTISPSSASDDKLPLVFGELLTQAVARRVQHVAGPEWRAEGLCVYREHRSVGRTVNILTQKQHLCRRLAGGADASVGLLFSGGLDSTVLAALAAEAGSWVSEKRFENLWSYIKAQRTFAIYLFFIVFS